MVMYLNRLEIPVEGDTIVVPSFRPDLVRMVDIAEEVGRSYGYNEIPVTQFRTATHGGYSREMKLGVKTGTLCRAMGIRRVRVVDPYDLKATEQVVTEELAADEPSVIITRRPCVLLKTVQKHPPYRVEAEACKGCKQCMKIGCPAISWKDKKAVVDPTQCVGCGVCEQLCKFGAFRHEG